MDLLGVIVVNTVLIAWMWWEICKLNDKIKDLARCFLVILARRLKEEDEE